MSPQRLLIIAVFVLVFHGIEQLMFGLDELYELQRIIAPFYAMSADGDRVTVLLVFAVTMIVILLCSALVSPGLPRRLGLTFFGVEFIGESHHLIKTLINGAYFPGAVSAIALVIVGVLVLRSAWRGFGQAHDLPRRHSPQPQGDNG
jgi:ABC-type multidrug transport system permease subunit